MVCSHEWYDGDSAYRWLNQTNFVPLIDGPTSSGTTSSGSAGGGGSERSGDGGNSGRPMGQQQPQALLGHRQHETTATRALAHTLAPSTFMSMADSSSSSSSSSWQEHPKSNTSRYFSVDIGLGHFIALDSNVYVNKLDTQWIQAQLDWLAADLASVDRTKTPWVIAMAHHPLRISSSSNADEMPASWYESEAAEMDGIENAPQEMVDRFRKVRHGRHHCFASEHDCPLSAGEAVASASASWEELFHEHGVDFYIAGHYHECAWPCPPACLPAFLRTQSTGQTWVLNNSRCGPTTSLSSSDFSVLSVLLTI